jgi:hypothetical protein
VRFFNRVEAVVIPSLAVAILGAMIPVHGMAAASAVYLAPTATGSANGSSCANAYAYTFFNTAANWGSGPSQIGPGTTAYLCSGTYTGATEGGSNFLTFQGSGTSANPITLQFMSGAVITSPCWGNGYVIYISGNNYVTVNGGGVGVIQATLSGSPGASCVGGSCSYSPSSYGGAGVVITGSSNVTVTGLTVSDMYVHSGTGNDTNANSAGVAILGGGSNISIYNNTVHDMQTGIYTSYSTFRETGYHIYNNTIYNVNWGVGGGDNSSGSSLAGVYVYGNIIHDFANWNTTSDAFHHNGIYIWAETGTSTVSNAYFYNNYIYGNFGGSYCTAGIFLSVDAGYSTFTNTYLFNNVIDESSGNSCGNGVISNNIAGTNLLNNVFVNGIIDAPNGPIGNGVFENNIMYWTGSPAQGLYNTTAGLAISNYNDWYNLGGGTAMTYNNSGYSTVAAYVNATGFDTHSITSNPKLSGTYQPQAGSPAIQAGTNLTNICTGQPNPGLGALCYDAAGNARPASGPWDIGAYQYTVNITNTPSNLTVVAQ